MAERPRSGMDESPPTPNPKQNSKVRALTAEYRYGTAGFLHRIFPRLTANQVTYIGVGLVAAGVGIAEAQNISGNKNKKLRTFAAGLMILGYLCDAIDGPLSTIIAKETGEKDPNGGHKDTLADRIQEIIQNFLRARTAHKLGRKWGRDMALGNTVLTTVPSAARAADEILGYHPPEMGSKLSFFGTRTGRAILNGIATFIPDIKGKPIQPVVETIQVASNLLATAERVAFPFNPDNPRDLSQELREESKVKAGFLTGVLGGTGLMAWVVNKGFRSNP